MRKEERFDAVLKQCLTAHAPAFLPHRVQTEVQGGDGLSVNTSAYHRVNGTELSPQDLDAEEPPWVLNSLNEAKGPDSAENFVSFR